MSELQHDYAKCGTYDIFGKSLCPACLDRSLAGFLEVRIGALLDAWDQLPNDIAKLEELASVSQKISALRDGIESQAKECSYCRYCDRPITGEMFGKDKVWVDQDRQIICKTSEARDGLIGHEPKEA